MLEDRTKGIHRPPIAWASEQSARQGGKPIPMEEYKLSVPQCPFSGKFRAYDGGGNSEACPFVGRGGNHYSLNVPHGKKLDPSKFPSARLMVDELLLRWTPVELPGSVSPMVGGSGSQQCLVAVSDEMPSEKRPPPGSVIRIGEEVFVVHPEPPTDTNGGRPGTLLRLAAFPEGQADAKPDLLTRAFAGRASAKLYHMQNRIFMRAPNNINSVACYIATIAIHEFFWTDHSGVRGQHNPGASRSHINLMDSFLDLQTVYGISEAKCKEVRSFRDGKLKQDSFADPRLERIKVVAAILTLFSREHNLICEELMRRYPDRFPPSKSEGDPADEALFAQARLINQQVFIGVVQHDYLGAVSGKLDFMEARVSARPHPTPNPMQTSVEFNLMYRFHQTIPEKYDPATEHKITLDVDRELLRALVAPSGAFVAHNIPPWLRDVETQAIEWGRDRGAPLFNDLREALGMDRLTSFEQLNTTEDAKKSLHSFYEHIDDVELYVGCMVEQWSNLFDPSDSGYQGWGIPPTLLQSILNDALSSLLYDRYHTTDFTKENLTEWGFARATNMSLTRLITDHAGLGDVTHLYPFMALKPEDLPAGSLPAKVYEEKVVGFYDALRGENKSKQGKGESGEGVELQPRMKPW